MEIVDALIMPFKITELIKSVNPVKLYEYIYMNKPIIAPLYPESVYFNDYVYLYNDIDELMQYFGRVSKGELKAKNTYESNLKFIKSNTWASRIKIMQYEINQLICARKI